MHDHGNCARCDAQEERIARLEEAHAHAIFWLLRAYDSGHRHGWEEGPSSQETMKGLFTWLVDQGFDPNEPATPLFVPDIKAALEGRDEPA